MDFINFSESMKENLKDIKIMLDDEQLNQFYNYMNMLIEWNNKINLTSIVNENEIILKHFADSLTISKYIGDNSVIDVGTGAGFPGIPIKIVNKNNKVTLVDSLNKRINFLNEVIKDVKLNNIKAIHSRVEDLARIKEYRESYDIATSRAVARLNILLEYMMPFVKVGGRCICMKGVNVKEEIDEMEKALKILGGEVEKIEEFYLPKSDYKRSIIVVKKIKNTNIKYPRKAGIPAKNPIV